MLLQAWSVLAVMGVVHTASPRREWCEGGNCGLGVYGGDYTKYKEFPFIVFIIGMLDNEPQSTRICGGSVLSGHTVLTAAHCYYKKHNYVVRGGHEWYGHSSVVQIKVVAVITHEKFIPTDDGTITSEMMQYDVAVMKLKKNILKASRGVVQRVKIHNRFSEDITSAKVCGWGRTAASATENDYNPVLQCISIKFDLCHPYILCSGNHSEFASSVKVVLQGDSGSPVIVGERYQIAMVTALEGGKDLPGWNTFMKVSHHYDWIVKQMKVRPDHRNRPRQKKPVSRQPGHVG